jgi:hypothetical protein
MKIKKNTFCTLVLELFFPSTANCRKLKIPKKSKNRLPLQKSFHGPHLRPGGSIPAPAPKKLKLDGAGNGIGANEGTNPSTRSSATSSSGGGGGGQVRKQKKEGPELVAQTGTGGFGRNWWLSGRNWWLKAGTGGSVL